MAQTVVDLTLGTIRDLLVEEVRFLSGVGGQVKDVQTELLRMQSFLEEVDRRKSEESTVLSYVKEIRSLSYRIEDVVDKYVADVVLRNRTEGVKKILKRISCSLCECISVHEVGTEIADIKADISSLTASMDTYGIRASLDRQKPDVDDARKRWLWRLTYGVDQVEEDFVGRKEDIDILVAKLLDGDVRKHRIVSIWGMGGLGKTTSAEKIYHHEDIRGGFKAFAWVCISKDYIFENILQDMLGQLNPGKEKAANAPALVREICEVLKENKCLVVLDDVWELKDWELLQPAFPCANSKVLITTRNESVAKVGFSHPLGVLSEDEAWELLQKKAFTSSDSRDLGMDPQAMQQLGREMVRNCGYLPLAISVLGGILSAKKSLDAWKSLNEKIGVHMRGEGNDQKKIEGVLSLSYDDLPYRLKPCFLYLSRFPEDELIWVEHLCLFWMGEGLVSPEDQEKDETLRDVALRYFSELASRSLVQLEADDQYHPFSGLGEEFNRCRVHDLLRDLSLAKSKEEEFFSLMDFRGGKRPSATSCLRRLAIYVDDMLDGVPVTAKSSQSLRSLSLYAPPLHAPGGFMASNRNLFTGPIMDFNNLNLLKFLHLENVFFEGKRLPTEMSKLILLKFLSFDACKLEELPSWVGDLPFLQALYLGLGEIKIPNVLWKIKGLKYLFLPPRFVVGEKLVLDCLDELEILKNFDSKNCRIPDAPKLGNLRRLSAEINGNGSLSKFIGSIEASAKRLDHTRVQVYDCDFRSEEGMALLKKVFKSRNIHTLELGYNGHVSKLPDYEPCFFPNLVKLVLVGGEMSEDPMSTLEKLSNLRKLVLYNFVGEEMTCHANGFPQLRLLMLHDFLNFKRWKVEKGAMPCLLYLDLQKCPQLDMIPDGIRFITTLQKLQIYFMSEALMKRIEEGGEDFDKVRHVHSIRK